MTLNEAKQQIVDCFKTMYHSGMVNLFEGNISMRWGNHFLITPSQQSKETMTANMILEVDENGDSIYSDEKLKPSSEFKMHLEVYRLRPDVNACVHSHSLYATAFAISGKPIISNGIAESNVVFGQIPLAPYGRPGTPDIFKSFEKYLSDYNALLLENHGVITIGSDLTMAFSLAEAVEKTAKLLIISGTIGGEKSLPEDELALLRAYGLKIRKDNMRR